MVMDRYQDIVEIRQESVAIYKETVKRLRKGLQRFGGTLSEDFLLLDSFSKDRSRKCTM